MRCPPHAVASYLSANLLSDDSAALPAVGWFHAATEVRLQIQVLTKGIGNPAAAAAATAPAAKMFQGERNETGNNLWCKSYWIIVYCG